jgi:serine/threonine-protein kinase
VPPDTHDHTVVIHVTPGELLDERWRIETRIGQGAMGSVFKGRDVKANKPVAIKILAPEHCRKPKVVARFEREAEKMTGLRHQNIVQFHGHGRRGALPFIVMEFLEGLTLSDVLERAGGKVGLAETVAVVKQLASGLAFLHHHGLVHRDVKPQNVFVCVGGRVTILDLGVVRDQANPGLTRPGAMVGTPYYMSPEQILGAEDIDRRTDVYALAAVTFELLTGRPPYLGSNNFEVLYGHKNTPPPDASSLVKSIPKEVSKVLMRGLAKRRDDRPDTASEFAADLQAAAGTKKVDLGKAFDLGAKKPAADVAVQSTRLLRRPKQTAAKPPPPIASQPGESGIPEASNSDVLSVPGAPLPQTDETTAAGEQKTVILRFDRGEKTVVGPQPTLTQEQTGPSNPTAVAPTTGQLRVVVTTRGRAATAAVFVNGEKKGLTPRTLTLPAGHHDIRIELSGYTPVERRAEVVAGTSTNLRVQLERA